MADVGARPEIEDAIRADVDAGDLDAAAAQAVRAYGPELLGFLRALAGDEDLAAEALATACEQLWRHLARFRWEAALRTWFYQLGRNALHALRRDPRRRPARNLPLSVATSLAIVVRTPTAPHHRTENKRALEELRAALPPEDHELLILRLDRGLSWKDIARATAEGELAPPALTTRAAALRKRYERLKADLRAQARALGLLP